ncbi:MAG: hypothetical protein HYZ28_01125 [Myxococcales bacterium]|nr:hypothetical protein [Myxococcales bacterium]
MRAESVLAVLIAIGTARAAAGGELPVLQDGDLVFHQSRSRQSELVRIATGSAVTHVGVIFHSGGEPWVLEAVQPVSRTRLRAWINRGTKGTVVIKRLRDATSVLTPEVLEKMRRLGEGWLGRGYDGLFRWDDERLYCSELAYKLFDRAAGVRIGRLQKAGEMNLADPKVQAELRRRFARVAFNPEEPVVTPQSVFEDPALVTVFEG